MEIHESPGLSASSETILQPEMLVTVEPGIYVQGEGGVRIEDMILIRKGGNVNLTNMSKDLEI